MPARVAHTVDGRNDPLLGPAPMTLMIRGKRHFLVSGTVRNSLDTGRRVADSVKARRSDAKLVRIKNEIGDNQYATYVPDTSSNVNLF